MWGKQRDVKWLFGHGDADPIWSHFARVSGSNNLVKLKIYIYQCTHYWLVYIVTWARRAIRLHHAKYWNTVKACIINYTNLNSWKVIQMTAEEGILWLKKVSHRLTWEKNKILLENTGDKNQHTCYCENMTTMV